MFEPFHRLPEHRGSPPEAGSAGREARFATYVGAKKEEAHGGTTGSPMLNARDVRFLDV